jgi:hypothetical protein
MTSDSDTTSIKAMNSPAHLTADTISAYRGRRLDPSGILTLHAHVEACGECAALLAGAARAAGEPGDAGEHIGEEDTVAFVAGMTVEPRIDAHLAACPECRVMVEDLRAFRAELAAESAPPLRWRYLAAAAVLFLLTGASAWLALRATHPPTAPPQLVSSLWDGGRMVGLTASGELAGADGIDHSTRELLRATLRSGRLPRGPGPIQPDVAATALRSTEIRSGTFAVIAPVGLREVSDRPVFRWQPLPGASTYEVVIFDASLREIARSGKIKTTEWSPRKSLPRGLPLRWQVAAEGHGRRTIAPRLPDPVAAFEIITSAAAQKIENVKAALPGSHLALAAVYASEGLSAEAADEMAQLASRNPGSKLVDSLSNRMGAHPH